ncbi:MAG: Fpg/Nei family DNA glycosylase [Acidimicrobiales bacterium]
MPEGHTIHRLARDLKSTLRPGPVEASSPQGLFAEGATELDGHTLRRADAWGKHLFLDFNEAPLLHIHLGLIGKLRPKPIDAGEEGAIRLRLRGPETLWDLTGPMVCALIDPDDAQTITNDLGPDPLRRGASVENFVERLGRKSVPLAAALLDQKVMAGIGNVYRSEFCFLAGIDPRTPANSLDEDERRAMWDLAVEQLKLGVRLNRIVTRDPAEVGTTVGRIGGEDRLYVYKREGLPCHRCGTEIRLLEIAKRKAWLCPSCQS